MILSRDTSKQNLGDDVDVVVVAYNCDALVRQLLDQLLSAAEVGQIVIVDHGDGRSADVATSHGVVGIWNPKNPGFGAGQNLGFKSTTTEYVLLLNPDAAMEPSAISDGIDALRQEERVAAVAGLVFNPTTGQQERTGGVEITPLHVFGRAIGARRMIQALKLKSLIRKIPLFADWVDRSPDSSRYVETLSAAAIMIRRSAFEQVGGFDERFFLYGEDTDLCRRLRIANWTLLQLATPWAKHADGQTSSSTPQREIQWFRGLTEFALKWWSAPALTVTLAANLIVTTRILVVNPRHVRGAVRYLLVLPTLGWIRRDRRNSRQVTPV